MTTALRIREFFPDLQLDAQAEQAIAQTLDGNLNPVARVFVEAARKLALEQIDALLDLDVGASLLKAWVCYRDWKQRASKPGEGEYVELFEHELARSQSPTVEILFDDVVVASLQIKIEFTAVFRNARLLLRDQRIREFRVGKVDTSGALFVRDIEVFKQALAAIELPGVYALDPGIPLE